MTRLNARIAGIGFWCTGLPSWQAAREFVATGSLPHEAPAKPQPQLLAPNERRRAPESVAVALEVALAACADARVDPAMLPSVFASTHGDLAITDYMCATLATDPAALSPIRFHNSVHNAPAGYWTIAAQCHAASTSLSGWHASFAMLLLEAAVQAIATREPELMVAYDTESRGPLVEVSPSTPTFGVALVLAPTREGVELPRLRIGMADHAAHAAVALPRAFGALAAGNPMARSALPFLTALVSDVATAIDLPASAQTSLHVEFS